MIQRSSSTWQDLNWQEQIKELITDPEQLLSILALDSELLDSAKRASQLFPLRVTPAYVSRIQPGDPNDPLLRQILPLEAEHHVVEGYSSDPLHERQANPIKGLIHKYHGRVLVIGTTSCAINCRYCFRREFDYAGNRMSREDWHHIFEYLALNPSISEVIFSGGDPLMQSDEHFKWVLGELDALANVQRVRVHTRLPIVLPARITNELLQAFTESRFDHVWVMHCNHANELDAHVRESLQRISSAGITLLNQSVLLKGVNDDVATLEALSFALFRSRVLPYYLHLLDKVNGASHFDVSTAEAKHLHHDLAKRVPGYLLPRLVREESGKESKTLIN